MLAQYKSIRKNKAPWQKTLSDGDTVTYEVVCGTYIVTANKTKIRLAKRQFDKHFQKIKETP